MLAVIFSLMLSPALAKPMDADTRLWIQGQELQFNNFNLTTDRAESLAAILGDKWTGRLFLGEQWHGDLSSAMELYSSPVLTDYNFKGEPYVRAPLVIRSNGEVVGVAIITKMVNANHFKISYAIHPERRGQNIATRAIGILSQWIFANFPGAKITASVYPENERSQSALRRNGFRMVSEGAHLCEFQLESRPNLLKTGPPAWR